MQATGSHQIMAFGSDIMRLYDSRTGSVIIFAHRTDGGLWHVHAGPSEDDDALGTDVPTRQDAILKMIDLALESLGGTGYSTQVPHGLMEMP